MEAEVLAQDTPGAEMQVSRLCVANSFQGQWPRCFLCSPTHATPPLPHSASPFPIPLLPRLLAENVQDFWWAQKRKVGFLSGEHVGRSCHNSGPPDSLAFHLSSLGKGKCVKSSLPSLLCVKGTGTSVTGWPQPASPSFPRETDPQGHTRAGPFFVPSPPDIKNSAGFLGSINI